MRLKAGASPGMDSSSKQQDVARGCSAEAGTSKLQLLPNGLRRVEMAIVLRFCCG